MIRRRVGDEFWLITQRDHAQLAGTLARAFGNRQFARPVGGDVVYAAVDAHDDGWPLHDERPTLDPAGRPTDVFESPRSVSHSVWMASAERAAAIGPYAGLLVTLHQLSLSAHAAAAGMSDKIDDESRRRQFDLNKIQHALIELAKALRSQLGLAVDRPLRLGLADGWSTPAEETLKFDFRLLQAADALSLQLCCDNVPAGLIPQPHPRPGAAQAVLQVTHPAPFAVRVRPWPFERDALEVLVPYRAMPAMAYDGVERFRADFAAAPVRTVACEIRPA